MWALGIYLCGQPHPKGESLYALRDNANRNGALGAAFRESFLA